VRGRTVYQWRNFEAHQTGGWGGEGGHNKKVRGGWLGSRRALGGRDRRQNGDFLGYSDSEAGELDKRELDTSEARGDVRDPMPMKTGRRWKRGDFFKAGSRFFGKRGSLRNVLKKKK